jgi:hypothetical protein
MIAMCLEKGMVVGESGDDDCDVHGEGDGCRGVWR